MPEKIVGPFRQCCILVFNDKTEESMENEKSIQYLQPHWMPLDTTNLLQRETLALIYAPEEKKKKFNSEHSFKVHQLLIQSQVI